MKTLSLQFLAECFDLDREAGVLRWKVRPRHHFPTERGWRQSNGKFAGKVAGTISATTGYVVVNFLHSLFVVHRIIWAMEHGRWPKYIDHRDGDRTNNRPDNLRECSRSQNQCNRPKQSNNTSGFKGVHERPRGKWAATICIGGRRKYLGLFKSPADAHQAYSAAAKTLHGEFARCD